MMHFHYSHGYLQTAMTEVSVVYSDKHLLLVNKPEGLLSVPGRGPDKKDCVVSRLQADYPTVRIVHRLDCATSGLMILALNSEVHRELSRQFHDREVQKHYIACVAGEMASSSGSVSAPLICDWPNRPRQIVHSEGKPALTHYECLAREAGTSRVELKPVTGRSHQLRVHMQSIGHPILGDQLYASGPAREASQRLLLHASYLAVRHPVTNQQIEFYLDAPF